MKKAKELRLPSLKLGGDPEFGVSERFTVDYTINGVGNIGYDHGGDVGELRPRPGKPDRIIRNLRLMMVKIRELRPAQNIFGGGGQHLGKSTGGHIHFGIKNNCSIHDSRYCNNSCAGRAGFRSLVKALDHYIGRPMRKHKGGRRSYRSYGQLGDIRQKSHGFEYRTPPSWLTSPELAQSVLTVAYAIGQIHLYNRKFWTKTLDKWSKTRKRLVLSNSDIELLKKFSLEKDHCWLDQYILFMRDRSFDLGEAGTIKRWLENKGS